MEARIDQLLAASRSERLRSTKWLLLAVGAGPAISLLLLLLGAVILGLSSIGGSPYSRVTGMAAFVASRTAFGLTLATACALPAYFLIEYLVQRLSDEIIFKNLLTPAESLELLEYWSPGKRKLSNTLLILGAVTAVLMIGLAASKESLLETVKAWSTVASAFAAAAVCVIWFNKIRRARFHPRGTDYALQVEFGFASTVSNLASFTGSIASVFIWALFFLPIAAGGGLKWIAYGKSSLGSVATEAREQVDQYKEKAVKEYSETWQVMTEFLQDLTRLRSGTEHGSFEVTAEILNIRSEPSTTSTIVAQLPRGSLVTVEDRDLPTPMPTWVAITAEAGAGWVASRYLEEVGFSGIASEVGRGFYLILLIAGGGLMLAHVAVSVLRLNLLWVYLSTLISTLAAEASEWFLNYYFEPDLAKWVLFLLLALVAMFTSLLLTRTVSDA